MKKSSEVLEEEDSLVTPLLESLSMAVCPMDAGVLEEARDSPGVPSEKPQRRELLSAQVAASPPGLRRSERKRRASKHLRDYVD